MHKISKQLEELKLQLEKVTDTASPANYRERPNGRMNTIRYQIGVSREMLKVIIAEIKAEESEAKTILQKVKRWVRSQKGTHT
jgi:hypothetical protein